MPEFPKSVIGIALNFQETITRLAPSFSAPPYQSPPKAPILYLKTPNTWISSGQAIICPSAIPRLRAAGTLGLIVSRTACHVRAASALSHIAALTAVNDVSIPHESYYRPALRERCSDTFCAIGELSPISSHHSLFEIDVLVNNILRSSVRTRSLVRSIPNLIQDISEFMTLRPGDIVLIGEPDSSPLVSPGDTVRIEIPGVGCIENRVVAGS